MTGKRLSSIVRIENPDGMIWRIIEGENSQQFVLESKDKFDEQWNRQDVGSIKEMLKGLSIMVKINSRVL